MEHICIKNFGINRIIGSSILAVVSYFIFLRNIEKITKINEFIIPVLIIIILTVGMKNINNLNIDLFQCKLISKSKIMWLIQSIVYASYNLILVIPIVASLKKLIKNKASIKYISVCLGLTIFFISILTFLLLININENISQIEMPIIYVIDKKYPCYKSIYGFVILIAIFTTAISCGKGFLENICYEEKSYKNIAKIICIASVVISKISFSSLVEFLFPVFGYIGIVQLYFISKIK